VEIFGDLLKVGKELRMLEDFLVVGMLLPFIGDGFLDGLETTEIFLSYWLRAKCR